ncbi:MAG: retropepsin-like aspartic protease [Candidatus Omnitrophica bacterium]|nr:retropepsin-like aspartic protease [Candidatus Omnitrophota bacterium]
MNPFNKIILLALLFLNLFGLKNQAGADMLYLKNGRSIEGLVKKEDADNVDLEISFGSMKFSRKQIDHIDRSSPGEAELIRQQWADEKVKAQERAKEAELLREYEPKQVNVDKQSGHVMVTTTLNKKVKANLILDTGASLILLSNKIAGNLGINTNANSATPVELIVADGRRIKARMVILDTVSVQDSEVKNIEAAILPEKESASIPEDGLLGMSFLKKFNFKIDQKNDKLILEKL